MGFLRSDEPEWWVAALGRRIGSGPVLRGTGRIMHANAFTSTVVNEYSFI